MSILQEAPVATAAIEIVSRETPKRARPKLTGAIKKPATEADADFIVRGVVPPASEVALISIECIEPNPYQPRQHFSEEELENLANSVREHGVLQPVLVRPHPEREDWYQLIAGERRWRAATRAGLGKIPAIVRAVDDKTALELAIIENVQRVDVSPIESAQSYRRLAKEFDLSQNEIAQRVGKTRPVIANAMRLLDLPESVQQLIEEGKLSEAHGRALAAYSDYQAFLEVYVPLILPYGLNSKAFEKSLPTPWQIEQELIKHGVAARVDRSSYDREAAVKAHPKAFNVYDNYFLCLDLELDARLRAEHQEKLDAEAKALLEQIQGQNGGKGKVLKLDNLAYDKYDIIYSNDVVGCTKECPCRSVGCRKGDPTPRQVCLDPKRRRNLKTQATKKENQAKREAAKKDFEAISKTSDTVKTYVVRNRSNQLNTNASEDKEIRRALAILLRPALKGAKVDVLRAAMARRGWTKEQFDIAKLKEYEAGKTLDELMKLGTEDMISFALEVDLHQEIQECLDTGYRGRHNADWFLQIKKKQKPNAEAKAETGTEAPPEAAAE